MDKIQNIQKLKLPETAKQIKSFLGITGYYRKFVKDYAKVAQGKTKYLKKNCKINKNDPQCINTFQKLKRMFSDAPILKYPKQKNSNHNPSSSLALQPVVRSRPAVV